MDRETRALGRTAVRVTTIGLGGATLGGNMDAVGDDEARALVGAAYDAGIRYFDTAPFYGYGKSERVVGDALRPRSGWVLSTKVGRLLKPRTTPRTPDDQWVDPLPFEQVYDYGYDAVLRSAEDSLQRLGLDHVDILYLHDIGSYQHGAEKHAVYFKQAMEGGYKALDRLRSEGTIKAIGIGVNEWQVLKDALAYGQWDAFLLAGRYTLLEQESLHNLLEPCLKAGTSIVVGGPFNAGLLVGRDVWNYAKAPPWALERAKALGRVCEAHGVPLPVAALKFPLAHPAVAAVIPGPRSRAEFQQIMSWWDTPVPASLWTDLRSEGLIAADAPVPA
jgi:D-threo-aldose 1-dehydrogenase